VNRRRICLSLWLVSLAVLVLAGCGLPSPTPGLTPGPSGVARAPSATPPIATDTAVLSPTVPPTTAAPPSAALTPTPLPSSPTPTSPPASATITHLPPSSTPTFPPTTVAGPHVAFFRVTPVTTQNAGDPLSMEWQAVGDRAEICPIDGTGPIASWCRDVPLVGSSEFVTAEESMGVVALGLRVWAGTAFTWSVVDVQLQCQNLRQWFFDTAPQRCPDSAPRESYAAGQYFERGLMVWIADWDDFYVFYRGKDEQGFQTFDWILEPVLRPGASEGHRVGETPPAGLYEPVSGFGLIWRGEMEGVRADVRQRLGWATAPEAGFDTAYQCVTPSHPHLWTCFLRGPQGEILRLSPDSSAQVRFLWEEW
jgi:hypothetical protein